MVEHYLAMVDRAGSTPVSRSFYKEGHMKRFDFLKTKSISFINTNGDVLTISVGTIEKVPSKVHVFRFHGSAPVKNSICSGSDVIIELRHIKCSIKKNCCAL